MSVNKFCLRLLLLPLAIALVAGCATPKKVNYLQDMTHGSQIELENRFEATISVYDDLSINISCHDPDLAKPFNMSSVYSSVDYGYNSTYGVRGYLVDVNGNIELPVLGVLHVQGLTRLKLQELIKQKLIEGHYLEDPFVMVRFNNFKIFFLGSKGGSVLNVHNERCTFLEALAMNGDLDLYTRRDRIAVMREVDGQMVMRYLDPRSSEVFKDPFFMLQQNDFIITQRMTSRDRLSELSFWLSWVTTLSSVATLLATIVVKK